MTPNWFANEHAQGSIDFKGHTKAAFEVLTGGYAQKFGKQGWEQVNGEDTKTSSKVHVKTAAKGSRRERRTRRGKWEESDRAKQRNELRAKLRSGR